MKTKTRLEETRTGNKSAAEQWIRFLRLSLLSCALIASAGCGATGEKQQSDEFFTSGNREADQRASQRMVRAEQLEAAGAEKESDDAEAQRKQTLYQRLGGERGIQKIVNDFVARALEDPRVNWERKGVTRGGFFGRNDSVTWNATPQNVARLKKHIAQFFAVATGGPTEYQGEEMKSAHADLRITNAEFDAAVGDLKASMDKLQVPNQEQKEVLAIVESTRPQIVEER